METKTEIQAAINKKIKGQGTAIDAGSVLAPILLGILDLIPEEFEQVQADWDEEDEDEPSYIQNKPIFVATDGDLTNMPVSRLEKLRRSSFLDVSGVSGFSGYDLYPRESMAIADVSVTDLNNKTIAEQYLDEDDDERIDACFGFAPLDSSSKIHVIDMFLCIVNESREVFRLMHIEL